MDPKRFSNGYHGNPYYCLFCYANKLESSFSTWEELHAHTIMYHENLYDDVNTTIAQQALTDATIDKIYQAAPLNYPYYNCHQSSSNTKEVQALRQVRRSSNEVASTNEFARKKSVIQHGRQYSTQHAVNQAYSIENNTPNAPHNKAPFSYQNFLNNRFVDTNAQFKKINNETRTPVAEIIVTPKIPPNVEVQNFTRNGQHNTSINSNYYNTGLYNIQIKAKDNQVKIPNTQKNIATTISRNTDIRNFIRNNQHNTVPMRNANYYNTSFNNEQKNEKDNRVSHQIAQKNVAATIPPITDTRNSLHNTAPVINSRYFNAGFYNTQTKENDDQVKQPNAQKNIASTATSNVAQNYHHDTSPLFCENYIQNSRQLLNRLNTNFNTINANRQTKRKENKIEQTKKNERDNKIKQPKPRGRKNAAATKSLGTPDNLNDPRNGQQVGNFLVYHNPLHTVLSNIAQSKEKYNQVRQPNVQKNFAAATSLNTDIQNHTQISQSDAKQTKIKVNQIGQPKAQTVSTAQLNIITSPLQINNRPEKELPTARPNVQMHRHQATKTNETTTIIFEYGSELKRLLTCEQEYNKDPKAKTQQSNKQIDCQINMKENDESLQAIIPTDNGDPKEHDFISLNTSAEHGNEDTQQNNADISQSWETEVIKSNVNYVRGQSSLHSLKHNNDSNKNYHIKNPTLHVNGMNNKDTSKTVSENILKCEAANNLPKIRPDKESLSNKDSSDDFNTVTNNELVGGKEKKLKRKSDNKEQSMKNKFSKQNRCHKTVESFSGHEVASDNYNDKDITRSENRHHKITPDENSSSNAPDAKYITHLKEIIDYYKSISKPKEKLFKCRKCLIHFLKKYKLRTHLRKYDHGCKKWICVTCGLKLSKSAFKKHNANHHCKNDYDIVTDLSSSDSSSDSSEDEDEMLKSFTSSHSESQISKPERFKKIHDKNKNLNTTLADSDTTCTEESLKSESSNLQSRKSKHSAIHANECNKYPEPVIPDITITLRSYEDNKLQTPVFSNEQNEKSDEIPIVTNTQRTTKLSKEMRKNVYNSYSRTIYMCAICNVCFATVNTMRTHIYRTKNETNNTKVNKIPTHYIPKAEICSMCHLTFSSIITLKRHRTYHHDFKKIRTISDLTIIILPKKTKKTYANARRSVRLKMLQRLAKNKAIKWRKRNEELRLQVKHLNRNDSVHEITEKNTSDKNQSCPKDESKLLKIILYKCNSCCVHFITKDDFLDHLEENKHDIKERYRCPLCTYEFCDEEYLRFHMEIQHVPFEMDAAHFIIVESVQDDNNIQKNNNVLAYDLNKMILKECVIQLTDLQSTLVSTTSNDENVNVECTTRELKGPGVVNFEFKAEPSEEIDYEGTPITPNKSGKNDDDCDENQANDELDAKNISDGDASSIENLIVKDNTTETNDFKAGIETPGTDFPDETTKNENEDIFEAEDRFGNNYNNTESETKDSNKTLANYVEESSEFSTEISHRKNISHTQNSIKILPEAVIKIPSQKEEIPQEVNTNVQDSTLADSDTTCTEESLKSESSNLQSRKSKHSAIHSNECNKYPEPVIPDITITLRSDEDNKLQTPVFSNEQNEKSDEIPIVTNTQRTTKLSKERRKNVYNSYSRTIYMCAICNVCFATVSTMRTHIYRTKNETKYTKVNKIPTHYIPKAEICSICHLTFSSVITLKRHRTYHHDFKKIRTKSDLKIIILPQKTKKTYANERRFVRLKMLQRLAKNKAIKWRIRNEELRLQVKHLNRYDSVHKITEKNTSDKNQSCPKDESKRLNKSGKNDDDSDENQAIDELDAKNISDEDAFSVENLIVKGITIETNDFKAGIETPGTDFPQEVNRNVQDNNVNETSSEKDAACVSSTIRDLPNMNKTVPSGDLEVRKEVSENDNNATQIRESNPSTKTQNTIHESAANILIQGIEIFFIDLDSDDDCVKQSDTDFVGFNEKNALNRDSKDNTAYSEKNTTLNKSMSRSTEDLFKLLSSDIPSPDTTNPDVGESYNHADSTEKSEKDLQLSSKVIENPHKNVGTNIAKNQSQICDSTEIINIDDEPDISYKTSKNVTSHEAFNTNLQTRNNLKNQDVISSGDKEPFHENNSNSVNVSGINTEKKNIDTKKPGKVQHVNNTDVTKIKKECDDSITLINIDDGPDISSNSPAVITNKPCNMNRERVNTFDSQEIIIIEDDSEKGPINYKNSSTEVVHENTTTTLNIKSEDVNKDQAGGAIPTKKNIEISSNDHKNTENNLNKETNNTLENQEIFIVDDERDDEATEKELYPDNNSDSIAENQDTVTTNDKIPSVNEPVQDMNLHFIEIDSDDTENNTDNVRPKRNRKLINFKFPKNSSATPKMCVSLDTSDEDFIVLDDEEDNVGVINQHEEKTTVDNKVSGTYAESVLANIKDEPKVEASTTVAPSPNTYSVDGIIEIYSDEE